MDELTAQDLQAGFDPGWLTCRASYDDIARDPGLEAQARRIWRPGSSVMDLGCGTGNNIAYLAARWPEVEQWTGVDHDPVLLAAAERRFSAEDLPFTGICAGLGELGAWADREQPSLMVANAVFDLFLPAEIDEFFRLLQQWKCPLWTTLLYTGMSWDPALPEESWVIGWYEAHMQRPRTGGAGLGPAAPGYLANCAEALGGIASLAPSRWEIPAEDQRMQGYLLGFMEEAVGEMMTSGEEAKRLADWLAARRLAPGHLTVTHQDLLITWP